MLFGEDKNVDFVLEGEMTNLRIVPIHPFSHKRSINIIYKEINNSIRSHHGFDMI